jgi:hypothetical protein
MTVLKLDELIMAVRVVKIQIAGSLEGIAS